MEEAKVLSILGKKEELKKILSGINKEEQEAIEYYQIIANQGESISHKVNISFQLFD